MCGAALVLLLVLSMVQCAAAGPHEWNELFRFMGGMNAARKEACNPATETCDDVAGAGLMILLMVGATGIAMKSSAKFRFDTPSLKQVSFAAVFFVACLLYLRSGEITEAAPAAAVADAASPADANEPAASEAQELLETWSQW